LQERESEFVAEKENEKEMKKGEEHKIVSMAGSKNIELMRKQKTN